jgi:HTH-type transcriptional regulator/antitoxin HigA
MSLEAMSRSAWSPDWATHPGEHLAEQLEARGWSQAEFARRSGLSPKLVSTIISGRNPVSADTALKLEGVLDLQAHIWVGLQARFDLHQARRREAARAGDADVR